MTLGLLPGGGGVTRLVRLLGLQAAFPFLMEGKRVRPQAALEAGLIHELGYAGRDAGQGAAWILANLTPNSRGMPTATKCRWHAQRNPKWRRCWRLPLAMLRVPKPAAVIRRRKQSCPPAVEGAPGRFRHRQPHRVALFRQTGNRPDRQNMIGSFWFQLNEIKAGGSRRKISPSPKSARWR